MNDNNNENHIIITTQEELNKVSKDYNGVIEFNSSKDKSTKTNCDNFKNLTSIVVTQGRVSLEGSDYLAYVYNDSCVVARGQGKIIAHDKCKVYAWDKCEVYAHDNSEVHAFNYSKVNQQSKKCKFIVCCNAAIIDCIEKSETTTNKQHKESRGK
jgi:hypothetical protein